MRPRVLRPIAVLACLALAGCRVMPAPRQPAATGATTPAPASSASPAAASPLVEVPAPGTQAPVDSAPAAAPAAGVAWPTLPEPTRPPGLPDGPPVVRAATETPLPSAGLAELRLAVDDKLTRLRLFLASSGFRVVLLSDPANYAWVTGGASNQPAGGGPAAVLAVLPDRALVLAGSDQLAAVRTPLRGLGLTGLALPWAEARDAAAVVQAARRSVGAGSIAADSYRPGVEYVGPAVRALREDLTALDRGRLQWLGATCGETVATVLRRLEAPQTELALGRRLETALRERGLTLVDLRVTALARLAADGLTPPGPATLASGAAVQLTAARWGLQVTLGRTVCGSAEPATVEAVVAARRIYAGTVAAVAAGQPLREVYATAVAAGGRVGLPGLARDLPPGGVGAYETAWQPCAPRATGRLAERQAVLVQVRLGRAVLADTLLLAAGEVRQITLTPGFPAPRQVVGTRLIAVPTLRGGELAVATAEAERATAGARARRTQFLQQLLGDTLADLKAATPATPATLPAAAAAPAGDEPDEDEREAARRPRRPAGATGGTARPTAPTP
ncbi:MAG: hypothetical protein IT204_07145 [Fimbriimonadaceae bacterium]|nr:hypothetical protein [Fimbriimonadaceae bacterium]